MNDDYVYAIRLLANDHGILNEDMVNKLANRMYEGDYTGIDEFLNETFSINDEHFDQDINFTIVEQNSNRLVKGFSNVISNEKHELINRIQDARLRSRTHGQQMLLSQPPIGNTIFNPSFGYIGGAMPTGLPSGLSSPWRSAVSPSRLYNADFDGEFNIDGLGPSINNFMNSINGISGITRPFNDDVQVTLTKEALNNLKEYGYKDLKDKLPTFDDTEKCAICLIDFKDNSDTSRYILLPCNHIFHTGCIKEHLENYNYQCPICKQECGEYEAHV